MKYIIIILSFFLKQSVPAGMRKLIVVLQLYIYYCSKMWLQFQELSISFLILKIRLSIQHILEPWNYYLPHHMWSLLIISSITIQSSLRWILIDNWPKYNFSMNIQSMLPTICIYTLRIIQSQIWLLFSQLVSLPLQK